MPLRNTRESWGLVARLLHWLIALLILALVAIGLYAANGFTDSFDDLMARKDLTQFHKSLGFTAFVLVALRLVWRAVNPTPAPPPQSDALERAIARAGHVGLYALMIAVPVFGWLMASSSPLNDADAYPQTIPNEVFGLFHMPDPYPVGDREVSEFWGWMHFWAAMALIAVVAGHALAALWHHFVRGDNVLMRMIRGR